MNGTNVRFINALILIVFSLLGLTGLYGLVWPFPPALFEIHRIAAWAFIALLPWKGAIALRSLRRGPGNSFDRGIMLGVSLLLALAALAVVFLALMWAWQVGPYYVWIGQYAYSGIGWHWGIALGLAPFFILHAWHRWPRPKKVDFAGRRQALKLMGLGAAALVGWGVAGSLARASERTGMQRRFTGSREEASFGGNTHPVTSGADQGRIKIDPDPWRLQVTGAVTTPLALAYDEILALSTSEATATLDCTGGWYTVQTWRGVPLTELLSRARVHEGAMAVILKGVLNYSAPFTLAQSEEILLATHVGQEVINHSHGFPLRAVVPSRRGWHWVKWLTEIEVVRV